MRLLKHAYQKSKNTYHWISWRPLAFQNSWKYFYNCKYHRCKFHIVNYKESKEKKKSSKTGKLYFKVTTLNQAPFYYYTDFFFYAGEHVVYYSSFLQYNEMWKSFWTGCLLYLSARKLCCLPCFLKTVKILVIHNFGKILEKYLWRISFWVK